MLFQETIQPHSCDVRKMVTVVPHCSLGRIAVLEGSALDADCASLESADYIIRTRPPNE